MDKDTRKYGITIEYFSTQEAYEPYDMKVKMELLTY